MKKILVLAMCGMLCFASTGCNMGSGEDKEAARIQELASNISTDIKSGEFLLDNVKYSFPMNLQELLDNGWTISTSYANKDGFVLEPNYASNDFELFNEDEDFIRVSVINFSDKDAEIEECLVERIYMSTTEVDVILPGGVYKHYKPAEIEAVYGESDNKKADTGSVDYNFTYSVDDQYKCNITMNVIDNDYTIDPFTSVEYSITDVGNNGVFYSDYSEGKDGNQIFQAYADNIMNASYYGDYAEYVKSGASTEEEAKELYESMTDYYADAILYYIGVKSESVDADTKAQYVEFAKKVMAKVKWEYEDITVGQTGTGIVRLQLYPVNLYDVIQEPLVGTLQSFQEKYAGVDVEAALQEEQAAMETDYAKMALETMEGLLDQVTADTAKSEMYTIENYVLTQDQWNEIDNILLNVKE
ncbi:MAG: hypothetical protein K2M46_08610 [Lachnospiraceae bacterium]|nr:hypothetical protein [Lachnospiraceae bacterium]